jgi:hypothetical protein
LGDQRFSWPFIHREALTGDYLFRSNTESRGNGRRYRFKTAIKIIDLGLRLDDVIELGLEGASEEVFDNGSVDSRRDNLLMNGATEAEVEFLLKRRVELNALTSDQLVRFVEKKLADRHLISKSTNLR